MIEEIKIDELLSTEYYSNSSQVIIKKINEIIGVVNKMYNNIDELMTDLSYRETTTMECSEY